MILIAFICVLILTIFSAHPQRLAADSNSLWFYISYSSILSVDYELTEARRTLLTNINFCLGLTNA